MKALTLHPLWAHLVVHGPKRVENRSWRTHHRGALLIHAGARPSPTLQECAEYGIEPGAVVTRSLVGIVDVLDCVRVEDLSPANRFAVGPWCWILGNVRAFPSPIPWVGRQMLFEVEM